MSHDNRVFNVNGKGQDMLLATLKLVQAQAYSKFRGYKVSKKHGIILLWCAEKGISFPSELSAEEVTPIVLSWLNSKEAKEIETVDWDKDADHDGSNSVGWRVYCEDWGHVDHESYAICAVKPVFLWHGK